MGLDVPSKTFTSSSGSSQTDAMHQRFQPLTHPEIRGGIQKVDPPTGSVIHTIEVLGTGIEGSTFWILSRARERITPPDSANLHFMGSNSTSRKGSFQLYGICGLSLIILRVPILWGQILKRESLGTLAQTNS